MINFLRLNALSGIGGVQTEMVIVLVLLIVLLRLNALSGIGGVQTHRCAPGRAADPPARS